MPPRLRLDPLTPSSTPAQKPAATPWIFMFIAVCLVAVNMRATVTSVGPLLEDIARDLGTTPAALGAIASLPLIMWAIVSPVVHSLSMRFGMNRVVGWSLVVLSIGTVWRSLPGGSLSLWLGTACIGAALAVGNVLMPAIVRRDFPSRIPFVMGVYSAVLSGFGAIAAGIVVPLAHLEVSDSLLGWRMALLLAGAAAPVALVVWVIATRSRAHGAGAVAASNTARAESAEAPRATLPHGTVAKRIWRDRVAWSVALYMGLQSLSFYSIATWAAPIQTSSGRTPVEAGFDVMTFQLAGIAGSVLLPLMYRGFMRRWLAALFPIVLAASFGCIVLLPGANLVPLLLTGFCTGATLSLSLMLIALRAREQETSSALSGMAQSVGYLVAATGPIIFGLLFKFSGGWGVPLGFIGAVCAIQLVIGLSLGRERFVFGSSRA